VELSTWVRYALPTDGVNPPTLPRRICIAGAQGFSLAASAPEGLATSLSCDFNMYNMFQHVHDMCMYMYHSYAHDSLLSVRSLPMRLFATHRSV
jgi:hypothetical protein